MKEFFLVKPLDEVRAFAELFRPVGEEVVPLEQAWGRVIAQDILCQDPVPPFARSTMDGFAVAARSTFGASFSNPCQLAVVGTVPMGRAADFGIGPGQAARISTGGMLPAGADAVVMVEHTETIDDITIEVYKSIAPKENVTLAGEDIAAGQIALAAGTRIRAQEAALLAAVGVCEIPVFLRPVVGILSTGDEVDPPSAPPAPGRIRDMNTYALCGQCLGVGCTPLVLGIAPDSEEPLFTAISQALSRCDILLLSGGSSVGARDLAVGAILKCSQAKILAHGVAISPGKPTIVAQAGPKPIIGLPGHVVSAMVAFEVVAKPFLQTLAGLGGQQAPVPVKARLARNLAKKKGREEFVRVRLVAKDGEIVAHPILGKSGEIRTMIAADGLLRIPANDEGMEAGEQAFVLPLT
ncbi:MAG: molybdopterin molybdotransferase MoeA [Desulfatibacillaceae bacterium]|nr:molybdopterin molybdotransferase MoeA [Desulfatibacillaceae bacterium]